MEKYSAFRDPGTGIQPFLTPVPPVGSNALLTNLTLPLRYVVGIIRTLLIFILAALHIVLVEGVCLILQPIPPLHRLIAGILTSITCRSILLFLGLWWIPVEYVTKKRGRNASKPQPWKPKAGDIIVANWSSWIELLWLAFRFNPVFVLPVSEPAPPASSNIDSAAISRTPGRRTGTGSAALSTPTRTPTKRRPIVGFCTTSLLKAITFTGQAPLSTSDVDDSSYSSLEDLRRSVDRPIVIFPECTTTNNRGLLKFADVFKGIKVPVKDFQVFIACFRYDPPTAFSPTATHSIPTQMNPLAHLFTLASSFKPAPLSVRLLSASEGPSSPLFMASEVITADVGDDILAAVCEGLILQLGKFKRLTMGWEDKASFLEFYRQKR
ncbi:hypothetical protein EVG20_g255 [Dentipellis fragilis]|uniref:Phospholipid/glycerol acyltransferase domain-containing protein n=1 Tax=Dentipellis fragilis TaxID=205917 RepID=A0A4Y9ZE74_9AGAM|nr:hypothetical protein EVG20_g255 [Dentipellis fragilis]